MPCVHALYDVMAMVVTLPKAFARHGDDLQAKVDVPLVDALCGGEISLTGIDGKPIRLRLDNVASGATKTLGGHGMPAKAGQ